MTNENVDLKSQLLQKEGEVAEQKACIKHLLLQHTESNNKLEQAKTDLKEAGALMNDFRAQLTKMSADRNIARLPRIQISPIQPQNPESKRLVQDLKGDDAPSFIKNMNKALRNENTGLQNKINE
uniref:AlNc14C1232G12843 protein n=1 Tax=Albugo laibachii Nc14 TaxID=890382 RepID=F0X2L1_9STRA|nr:AlNc14C1232G12843 [Albugo laibachii Nc14]|eukprot:CCA28123.1 AlNc14C1232G12843 [Albugo laibachii Nc14]